MTWLWLILAGAVLVAVAGGAGVNEATGDPIFSRGTFWLLTIAGSWLLAFGCLGAVLALIRTALP